MLEKDFVEQLVDLMDTEEEITMDTILENVDEWDSLSYVAFLAMCASVTDKRVAPTDVKAAKTVKDLYDLISE